MLGHQRVLRGLVWVSIPATILVLGEIHAHLIGHYVFGSGARLIWTLIYVGLVVVVTYAAGIPDVPRTIVGTFARAGIAIAVAALVISVIQLVLGSLLMPRFVVFGSAAVLFPVMSGLTILSGRYRLHAEGADRVVAVVTEEEAEALGRDLEINPEKLARLVAVLPPTLGLVENGEIDADRPLLLLAEVAIKEKASVVVLDRIAQTSETILKDAAILHARGIRVRTLSLFYDEWLGKLPLTELERVSLMFDIQEVHQQQYARLKRIMDVVLALFGTVIFIAVIPLIWIVDRFGNRGPLFFTQERVGKGGVVFRILKFRTLSPVFGQRLNEWTSTGDPRLSKVGRVLRQWHIDEIPQVINILKGELSIVGPRPEQPHYVAELSEKIPFYEVRHLVQPGLTGWAQVKFHYGASVGDAMEKLQYEFYYLRHQGLVLDLKIIARTLRSVVGGAGR